MSVSALNQPHDSANPDDPGTLFQAGLVLLDRRDLPGDALRLFKRAHAISPEHPLYASYTGLCLAMVERRFDEAERLCRDAIDREGFRSDVHGNLGWVLLLRGQRRQAWQAFQRGLKVDPSDARIREAVTRMGVRHAPVVGFLPRSHQVNRTLGRWCHRMGIPPAPALRRSVDRHAGRGLEQGLLPRDGARLSDLSLRRAGESVRQRLCDVDVQHFLWLVQEHVGMAKAAGKPFAKPGRPRTYPLEVGRMMPVAYEP